MRRGVHRSQGARPHGTGHRHGSQTTAAPAGAARSTRERGPARGWAAHTTRHNQGRREMTDQRAGGPSQRNESRRRAIRAFRAEHPEASQAQVARKFNAAESVVWRALNPDAARSQERLRRDEKREWHREHYWRPCPGCGQRMDGHPQVKRCRNCEHPARHAVRAARGQRIEEWWAQGLSMLDIAARLGWSKGGVSGEMHRLRRLGFNLPRRRPPPTTTTPRATKGDTR